MIKLLLRVARTEARMSQRKVAEAMGVPKILISRLETSDRRVGFSDVAHFCAVVGITLSEFVRRYEEKRSPPPRFPASQ
jgi:transcriptional regulator with XRE-family HTH domain